MPCLGALSSSAGVLAHPLAALEDEEGARVAADLPKVVDAHVHLFPNRLFESVWRWFDQHGWPIRYKLHAQQVIDFLLSRGVDQLVVMQYAHRPGIAAEMNRWMAHLCRGQERLLPLATVYPGEEGTRAILEEGFALGLRGVKLHCHVQCLGPDHPALEEVYQLCSERGLPLVMHAGREPKSPAYKCDPYAICSADRVERVLENFPSLRLCVPHLGADEYGAYERLLERYDNLWLDTTMMVAGYFPFPPPPRLLTVRPERVLFGTDFPNLPYAWDRELRRLAGAGYRPEVLEALLGGNARRLFTGPAAPAR